MSSRVILNLDEELIHFIDMEKDRIGATRTGIVTRILERHFSERREEQRLYNEWFAAEVAKGMKSAREEPLVGHEEVVRQIDSIIAKAREENAADVV